MASVTSLAARMAKLEAARPEIDPNRVSAIFLTFLGAKDGKPVPESPINVIRSQDGSKVYRREAEESEADFEARVEAICEAEHARTGRVALMFLQSE